MQCKSWLYCTTTLPTTCTSKIKVGLEVEDVCINNIINITIILSFNVM